MATGRAPGRGARAVIAVAAAALTVVGCGGDGAVETAAVTTTTAEAATTTTTTVLAPTTTRRSAGTTTTRAAGPGTTRSRTAEARPEDRGDDPLARDDRPPDGVPGLIPLSMASEGPFECELAATTPTVSATPASVPVGAGTDICVAGFDASPVAIEVAVPGAATRRLSIDDAEHGVSFSIGPLDPTGLYRMTALQAAKRATGQFSVVLPGWTVVRTLDPTRAAPGTGFRFAIVSPNPNQTIAVDLYRVVRGNRAFVTALGSVTTDGQARATYLVPTLAGSPRGEYCLVARPADRTECGSFTVL